MYSADFRLLLQACRICGCETDISAALDIAGRETPDWNLLLERSSFHRVGPQLLSLLEKLPGELLPSPVRDKLKETVQDNLLRQLRYVEEFFRVSGWLADEGIDVIPFKGFWLGESAYGNIGARVSSDTDLFIDLRHLEAVKRVMTSKGYEGHDGLDRLTVEHVRREMAEYNFGRYADGARVAHIEFHWRSAMTFYRMDISLDDLRPQIIPGMLQGVEISVFSPAAILLLVVMHHGGKECYWQLRQVLDIAYILRKSPDLDSAWLLRQAERFHVTTLLLLGVRLAHELTGVAVPEAFAGCLSDRSLGNMARERIDLMALPPARLEQYKDRMASWIFKIRSREGVRIKASLTFYTLRKVIAPRMVPIKWRHHFFSRRIRRKTVD
ncbi:MAG: nucleotidyltransferase family protein [Bacteroidales bacterium]